MTVPAAQQAITDWKGRDVRGYTRAVGNELGDRLAAVLEDLISKYQDVHEDLAELQLAAERQFDANDELSRVEDLARRLHQAHQHGWPVCADPLCTLVRRELEE